MGTKWPTHTRQQFASPAIASATERAGRMPLQTTPNIWSHCASQRCPISPRPLHPSLPGLASITEPTSRYWRPAQYAWNCGPLESGGHFGRRILSGKGAGKSGPMIIASPGASMGMNWVAARSRSPHACSIVFRSCSLIRRCTMSVPNWLKTSCGMSRGRCVAKTQVSPYLRPSFAISPKESKRTLPYSSPIVRPKN